ncbi:MAG TPA: lysylphosphatidylglycerol synthase domain-containing protein [Rhodanobacteraceae bacterium]|nr:lysylphosphatidylglycerol synthase domain-containing protein [Rhodanobacteraceae bacterium]
MLNVLSHARVLLRPQVILPVLLAVALLVFAFSLGDIHNVIGRVGKLPIPVLWISLLSAACYLACKAAQLKLMLTQIDVDIPARPFWLAFAVGELTVTLPLGMFSQNWVLSASRRVHIGRSSAATVMMVLAEVAVVFLFLAVVGIPGWRDTRPFAVALLAATGLLLAGLMLFEHKARAMVTRLRRRWARRGAEAGLETLRGLRKLSTPLLLAVSIALAAVYLGALTFAFWIVGRGMDVHHLDYLTATTIYMFSLAIILVGAGLFSQIGTVELLGMLAARAWGIGYTDGLAMMLGFRIVWTGAIWLLCLPIVATMWREIPSHARPRSRDRGKEVSR